MTVVQGKMTLPDGSPALGGSVVYALAGANRAFVSADDETVVLSQRIPLLGAGAPAPGPGGYSIDLPGNTALAPAGTRWRRTVSIPGLQPFADDLIVPATGGPYTEEDILAEPLVPIPTTAPSNEVDSAEITTPPSAFTVDALNLDAVPGLVVTVPDLTQPVYLEADMAMSHSVANAAVNLVIAPVGSTILTNAKGQGQELLGAIGTGATCSARARLLPHSPGDYQVFVAGTAGSLTVQAQPYAPAQITALAV